MSCMDEVFGKGTVGPVKPWPLIQARQIRSASPVGATKNWDPADRSFRKTTRAAPAESEVRPGPRLPTLRARHVKIREAAPEALPTVSLPNICESAAVRPRRYRRSDRPNLDGPRLDRP